MIRHTLGIILLLSLVACANDAVRKKVEGLDHAIDNYAYALRWMRKNDAVAYHLNRDGSKPVIDTSMMDLIRVTGFSITDKIINDDLTVATVTGELNYIQNEYGTLKSITFNQSWWYDTESSKWYLDSEFPQFK